MRIKSGGAQFSSASDLTYYNPLPPNLSFLFPEAGDVMERPLVWSQTGWYEFAMSLANLVK